jgi:hypothetical protein
MRGGLLLNGIEDDRLSLCRDIVKISFSVDERLYDLSISLETASIMQDRPSFVVALGVALEARRSVMTGIDPISTAAIRAVIPVPSTASLGLAPAPNRR